MHQRTQVKGYIFREKILNISKCILFTNWRSYFLRRLIRRGAIKSIYVLTPSFIELELLAKREKLLSTNYTLIFSTFHNLLSIGIFCGQLSGKNICLEMDQLSRKKHGPNKSKVLHQKQLRQQPKEERILAFWAKKSLITASISLNQLKIQFILEN